MNMIEPEVKIEAAKPLRRRAGRPQGVVQTYTEREVMKVVKAALGAGMDRFRVDVDLKGNISLFPMRWVDEAGAANQADSDP
jgi:hypothetical protein